MSRGSHDRRRIVHFNVTTNPTSAWTGQQIREAFPWDTAPKYLLRDRDGIYGGAEFKGAVTSTGAEELKSAPRSPWHNPFVERLIGSIRRECLDHVIVFNERHLGRLLADYFDYYHRSRTHLSLDKDAPEAHSPGDTSLGARAAFRDAQVVPVHCVERRSEGTNRYGDANSSGGLK